MPKKIAFFLAIWACGICGQLQPPSAMSAGVGIELPALQETLEIGLLARRSVEFDFIARVVSLVQQGRIPIDMVETTFHWARRKHARHPFVYFQAGLRIRARRIGVEI